MVVFTMMTKYAHDHSCASSHDHPSICAVPFLLHIVVAQYRTFSSANYMNVKNGIKLYKVKKIM